MAVSQVDRLKNAGQLSLDRLLRHHELLGDRPVGQSLSDESEHLTLPLRQLVDPRQRRRPGHQPLGHRRIDHTTARRDPLQRVEEHVRIGHPILEQIARPRRTRPSHPHRIARVQVLGEHQHADLRESRTDALRSNQPFVGERRRHSDVDKRHVGDVPRDRLMQLAGVGNSREDLDVVITQQRCHAIAHQRGVISDHHPQRPPLITPLHVVHDHPTRQARKAHLTPGAEMQRRIGASQLAHHCGGQHLPTTSECRQPRGHHHRPRLGPLGSVNLARVQPHRHLRGRRGLLNRHRTTRRLRRTAESHRAADHHAAPVECDFTEGHTLLVVTSRATACLHLGRKHRVRAVPQHLPHGMRAYPLRMPAGHGTTDRSPDASPQRYCRVSRGAACWRTMPNAGPPLPGPGHRPDAHRRAAAPAGSPE